MPTGRNQPPVGLVVFDADDTLWATAPVMSSSLDRCQRLVEAAGYDGARWRSLHTENDIAMTHHGVPPVVSFPTAARKGYEALMKEVGAPVDPTVASRIFDAAAAAFTTPAVNYPGVARVLSQLKNAGYTLVLLTKGDAHTQALRVVQSGLGSYFDDVQIVPAKSEAVFRAIALRNGMDADKCWSVGNSLPSDINPALAVGMKGVWIDADVWAYERRETVAKDGHLVRLAKITQVPRTIRGLHVPTPHISRKSSPKTL